MSADNIHQLLARKAKADALPPETKQEFAEHYKLLVSQIVKYSMDHPLPTWDEEVNSEILSIIIMEMAGKYEHKKPYVEWMCKSFIPEVDESFRTSDQARFEKCIQAARQQIRNV